MTRSQEFKDKIAIASGGSNNANYSGISDETILLLAKDYIEKKGSISGFMIWANKNHSVPLHFRKNFRFIEYGGGYEGFIEALLGMGIPKEKVKLNKFKSDTHKQNLSKANRGKKWYHNDELQKSKQIFPETVTDGWERGRKTYGS